MKKVLTILSLVICSYMYAQHIPLLGHYSNTGVFFNPAITGSRDVLTIESTFRKQWYGIKSAPHTELLSAHTPLNDEKIALGGFLYNDRIQFTNRSGFYINGAYRLPINLINHHEDGKLSLGLSAGVDLIRNHWEDATLTDENDPELKNDLDSYASPNFSFGTYYQDSKLYVSISLPFLLENEYEKDDVQTLLKINQLNYYLSSGYRLDVNSKFSITPSFLLRQKGLNNSQLDLTVLTLYNKFLQIGAIYRTSKSLSLLTGVQVSQQLKLSYIYNHSLINATAISNSSHELSIRYEFKYIDHTEDPKFF